MTVAARARVRGRARGRRPDASSGRSITPLVRIVPPPGVTVDHADAAPFVVVDPRAGHGPGIGGFKADSEIGVALQGRPSVLLRRLPARAHARSDASRTSGAPRRSSSKKSSRCIRRPTASPA